MSRARILLAALTVAAFAAPAVSQPARPTVTITLASHRYIPSPIYLAGGVPVRMIFVNNSGKTHDFTAPVFFQTSRILRGRAPGGEVRLGAGRSAIVDLIPVRGTYRVHCGEFLHKQLGMSTRMIVA